MMAGLLKRQLWWGMWWYSIWDEKVTKPLCIQATLRLNPDGRFLDRPVAVGSH